MTGCSTWNGGSPCIEWTRAKTNGYGAQWNPRLKRVERAHRVAWEEANGPIPEGLCVCHHCDNPACINVEHLFLGTKAENLLDMRKKGRGSKPPIHRGELQHSAKLTIEDVRKIRRAYRGGATNKSKLGRFFGVTHKTIERVVLGRSWRHV